MNPYNIQHPDNTHEKAYQLALRYLGYRARSVMETARYLTLKNISGPVVDKVIEKLKSYGYLNDTNFAKMFIENRKRFHPKSIFALRYELSQKGIHDMVIQDVLQSETDENLAWLALSLKLNLWRHMEPEPFRKKVLSFLKTRGFGYESSVLALQKLNYAYHDFGEEDNED